MSKSMNEEQQNKDLSALYQSRKKRYASPDDLTSNIYQKLATSVTNKKPWWKIELKQYMQISAFAVSCAFAFIVINSQLITQNDIQSIDAGDNLVAYNNVTYHVLDDEQQAPLARSLASNRLMSAPDARKMNDRAEAAIESESENAQIADDIDSEVLSSKEVSDKLAKIQKSRSEETQQRRVKYQQASASYLAKQSGIYEHHQTYATVVQSESGLDLLTCEKELLKISQEVVDMLFGTESRALQPLTQGRLVSLSFDKKGHIIKLVEEKQKTQC